MFKVAREGKDRIFSKDYSPASAKKLEVGRVYNVKCAKVPVSKSISALVRSSLKDCAYPWSARESQSADVRIESEYPNFYVATVLPYKEEGMTAPSTPYSITLDKHDMFSGILIVEDKDTATEEQDFTYLSEEQLEMA